MTEELTNMKKQYNETSISKEEIEIQLSLMKKDNDQLQRTCSKYQDDVSHISTEAARLRMDIEDVREDLHREKMRTDSLQRIVDNTQSALDHRSKELSEAMHALAMMKMGSSGHDTEEMLRNERTKMVMRIKELEEAQRQ